MGERYTDAMRKARIQRLVQTVQLFMDEFELTPGGY